jgi:ABC-2 type transport system permease protein
MARVPSRRTLWARRCHIATATSVFGAKVGRHVEELLVSPMPSWVILGGYVAGAVLRGLLVGIIVLCIAMLFTTVRISHPLVTLTTVLLGAVIFSLAGFVNAVFARKFDDVAIVPIFILTPLTYLGGVFYSVKLLPAWAETATHANPRATSVGQHDQAVMYFTWTWSMVPLNLKGTLSQ